MRALIGALWVVATCLVSTKAAAQETRASIPVAIRVDAAHSLGKLEPIYRFFGADEPNYATMKDGRKLIAELGKLGTPQVIVTFSPSSSSYSFSGS